MTYLAFGMSSGWELLLVLVIVVILFGAGKLPKVMGQLGKGLKAFKDGSKEGDDDGSVDVTPETSEESVEPEKPEEPKALDEAPPATTIPDVEEAQEVVADAPEEEAQEVVADAPEEDKTE